MRARFLLASITGILGSFWGQSVWAQSVSILDAVQVVSPTLTIFLVREDTNPPQCLNFPIPDYCFQALRGQVAVYPVGVDGAGNSYNLVALDPVSANAAEHGYSFQQMDGSGNFQEIARIIGETSADPVTGQFKKYVLGLPRFDVTNGEVMFALLGSICTSTSGF